jgi:hypothetical protein
MTSKALRDLGTLWMSQIGRLRCLRDELSPRIDDIGFAVL